MPDILRQKIIDMVAEYTRRELDAKRFTPGVDRVLIAGRVYDEQEAVNLVDAALDFWLTADRYANDFEAKLEKFLNVRDAVLCNSGSSANLLAVSALTSKELGDRALRPGDEVITVAAGFPTTVNCLLQNNLAPVFVDIELESYNIDVRGLEQAKSDKTKAVMLAHTLGHPFDLDAVVDFCQKNDLWLIEDNCDALGSK